MFKAKQRYFLVTRSNVPYSLFILFCVIVRLIPRQKRKKYRLYSPSTLTNAYRMVKENQMSVKKASNIFQVPDTTLRDRVHQKVDPETAGFFGGRAQCWNALKRQT